MSCDLPAVQTQHLRASRGVVDLPSCTTSGFNTRHFTPCAARCASGSVRMGCIRLFGRVSLLSCSSLRQRAMSWGLKILAADAGIVFLKKLRSSTFMARFTGGANMSSAMERAISQAHIQPTTSYVPCLVRLAPVISKVSAMTGAKNQGPSRQAWARIHAYY